MISSILSKPAWPIESNQILSIVFLFICFVSKMKKEKIIL